MSSTLRSRLRRRPVRLWERRPICLLSRPKGKLVDARSDIFSFGLVLYEMLSGQSAFAGDSPVTTLAAILRDEPPRLRNISPELERIVTRCLRKDPARRFQTMLDVKALWKMAAD